MVRDEETKTLLRVLGNNIRAAREDAGLSMEELAERMRKIDSKTVRENTQAFGRNIRMAREDAGLSVEELARQVGISTIKMRRIERDAYRCNLSTGGKIASALGVDLAILFRRC